MDSSHENIVLNQKGKNRSIYELTDAPENVENTTIVFETFGGKNYSDSPKYIYEYMQEKYPYYNYVWSFKNLLHTLCQEMRKR